MLVGPYLEAQPSGVDGEREAEERAAPLLGRSEAGDGSRIGAGIEGEPEAVVDLLPIGDPDEQVPPGGHLRVDADGAERACGRATLARSICCVEEGGPDLCAPGLGALCGCAA